MASKSQPAAPTYPVRWTDEEWQTIAARILAMKGNAAPSSIDVEEIKAKDVFLAQDVLPEARHRKLISIQQGFDASRHRLRAHLDALPPPEATAALPADAGAAGDTEPAATAATEDADAAYAGAQAGAAPESEPERTETDTPPGSAPDMGAQESLDGVNESADANPQPQDQHPGTAAKPGRNRAAQSGAAATASGVSDAAAPAADPSPAGTAANRRDHGKRTEPREAPATLQPSAADFVEMARPFVAMVCQEFATALVKAFAENSGNAFMGGLAGRTAKAPAAQDKDRERAPFGRDRETSAARAPAPAKPVEHVAPELDEDDDQHESDVQPLFDPKLPPAANSPFRPRIALVASRTGDLDDLQQRFPQLELIALTLDELRSNPVLRTCQRIVGLREDVPAPADEYLRRTFGSRYFRANGGIGKVREQLQLWLNNPALAGADAARPNKPGNAKGGNPKKRQFRRPRA